jgi:tetratricopeptide (TPR) repeat protein
VPDFKLNTMAEAQKQAGRVRCRGAARQLPDAVELHNAGKIDEAEAAYKAIIEKYARRRRDLPEPRPALSSARRTIRPPKPRSEGPRAAPDSTDISTLLARTYQESGQPDKAMALLEKAAGANPADAKAQFNRGIFLLNANKNEEAIAAFQAAIKADPAAPEAYFRLGALMIGQGKIPDAITNLEKYLSLNPTDAQNVATAQGLLKALKK